MMSDYPHDPTRRRGCEHVSAAVWRVANRIQPGIAILRRVPVEHRDHVRAALLRAGQGNRSVDVALARLEVEVGSLLAEPGERAALDALGKALTEDRGNLRAMLESSL